MLYRLRRPHLSRHTVSRPPDPARASLGSTTTRLPLEPTARSRSLVDKIEQARAAAIRSLARDLRIDPSEAERWCVAWELFARRQGAARSVYFWDAGRGMDRRPARHGQGRPFSGAPASPRRQELPNLGRYRSPSRPGVLRLHRFDSEHADGVGVRQSAIGETKPTDVLGGPPGRRGRSAVNQPGRLAALSAAIHSAPTRQELPSRGSPLPAASICHASHHRSTISSGIPEPVRVLRIASRRAWDRYTEPWAQVAGACGV